MRRPTPIMHGARVCSNPRQISETTPMRRQRTTSSLTSSHVWCVCCRSQKFAERNNRNTHRWCETASNRLCRGYGQAEPNHLAQGFMRFVRFEPRPATSRPWADCCSCAAGMRGSSSRLNEKTAVSSTRLRSHHKRQHRVPAGLVATRRDAVLEARTACSPSRCAAQREPESGLPQFRAL